MLSHSRSLPFLTLLSLSCFEACLSFAALVVATALERWRSNLFNFHQTNFPGCEWSVPPVPTVQQTHWFATDVGN